MKKKGFTLFTALVAFALIALTALLIQGMIKAERDSLNLLNNIEEQSELQAIADLERADAINTFNLSLRFVLEDYFSDPEQGGVLNLQGKTWEELKKNFATVYFAGGVDADGRETGRQFATRFANELEKSLSATRQIGQNQVSFEKNTEDTIESLNQAFVANANNNSFFDVVTDLECKRGLPECIGTFYITLDTSSENLSDQDYEKLPKIVVTNLQTGRTIKQSILPRGKFKFFVPLRFFKALGEAFNLANSQNGLLSPRIHNELEEMRLGFCDRGYCAPRTNPFTPPNHKNLIGKSCPDGTNLPSFELDCTDAMQKKGICPNVGPQTSGFQYNARETDATTENSFKKIVQKRLCNVVSDSTSFSGSNDFILLNGNDLTDGCPNIYHIEVTPKSRKTKKGVSQTGNPTNEDTIIQPHYLANIQPANICPLSQSLNQGNRAIGLYQNSQGEIVNPVTEIKEKLRLQNIDPESEEFVSNSHDGDRMGACTELSNYKIEFRFKEKNKNYIVNKKLKGDDGKAFVLRIIDEFTPYTERFGFETINPDNCSLRGNPADFYDNIAIDECQSFENACVSS
ncbi:MAG: hypothetical protein Q7S21_04365 [archaeon]|nr:hypothetical protein [archaeon]